MSTKATVLIIEDERGMRRFLADVLEGEGYRVIEADNGGKGLEMAHSYGPEVVLTDFKMPGVNGLELVKALRTPEDAPEVIVLTAYGTVQTAVDAMKFGARDFIEKPVSGPDQVRITVARAFEHRRLVDENSRLRKASGTYSTDAVFSDAIMVKLMERVAKVAATDTTVLISGESGTGKEVLARELHRLRFGPDAPFVAINCAALPENLLESELFGYEKGAFTGAVDRKPGLFEAANDGTLFLDEVTELPIGLQAKLLRVLETREFTRIGGLRPRTTQARFVAAGNRDFSLAVEEGRIREDLYYRLSVFPVLIPPLRDRRDDIAPIALHFLKGFSRRFGRQFSLEDSAIKALRAYRWPGNVRELRNVLERACILAPEDVLVADDLDLPVAVSAEPAESSGLIAKNERDVVLRVLNECNGNRRQAAVRLGISLRTLQYRLKDWGLVER